MTQIRIAYPTGRAPLYHRYPAQTEPQTAHVVLACDSGHLTAEYNGEIGNAIPMAVWHGRTLRWGCSRYLSARECRELLDAVRPLAQRVIAGYSVEWDGNNHVGQYTADATEAQDAIGELCRAAEGSEHVWRAEDWIADVWPGDLLDSGETVEAAAVRLAREAEEDGIVLDGDLADAVRARNDA